MKDFQHITSPHNITLNHRDLRSMIDLIRSLQRLSEQPGYRAEIAPELPPSARFNPGNHSVMMGYDFHLSATGPQLIEVNTNAGGLWPACLTHNPDAVTFTDRMREKLLRTFMDDYALWKCYSLAKPATVVIIDEHPDQQFLYSEMGVFSELLQQADINTAIADPNELISKPAGLYLSKKPVSMIYNRHCDFYLDSAEMKNIRVAWLGNQVCLSPNPYTYGLLGDKRRMIVWSDLKRMSGFGLSDKNFKIITSAVPATRLLNTFDPEELWSQRKQWIFKPASLYASRGVYTGKKLTKKKFNELDPDTTLVQKLIPPSLTHTDSGLSFKTDYRVFTYRDRILCVTARLYRGQVTNLRTEEGGFASVKIV